MNITPQFVDFIPEYLEDGTIYISINYATASHNCCCGCGRKVVTPLSPTDWSLVFDGRTISLFPSIGNWAFPCKSHYWIRRNKVEWAAKWSAKEIEQARERDRSDKESYFSPKAIEQIDSAKQVSDNKPAKPKKGKLRRFLGL